MIAGRRRAAPRPVPAASTEPVHLPEPDERQAYRILDFALRAGELLLSGGEAAAEVTAMTIAITRACGLPYVVSEVTFTSITLSYVRAPDVAPVTSVRLVEQRTPDYTRVTEVHNLVDDLVARRVTPAEAIERLDRIRERRHPYRRWVVTGFRAVLAAAVAVLLGAGVLVTVIAFLTTVVVDRTTGALAARLVPDFYANTVGAAIATTVAMLVLVADLDVRPSLIVASGIVLLLPGITLVGAVQDAINGFPLTATARAFEVFVLTAGIVTGVAAVLSLADRLSLPLAVNQPPSTGWGDVPVQLVAAVLSAAAAAGASYAPRRTLPAAGVAAGLGWGAFRGLDELGLDPALATGVAAVLVGGRCLPDRPPAAGVTADLRRRRDHPAAPGSDDLPRHAAARRRQHRDGSGAAEPGDHDRPGPGRRGDPRRVHRPAGVGAGACAGAAPRPAGARCRRHGGGPDEPSGRVTAPSRGADARSVRRPGTPDRRGRGGLVPAGSRDRARLHRALRASAGDDASARPDSRRCQGPREGLR